MLFRVIRDLTQDGVAIIYISHHLEEALEIADHVVVLRDGQLVADAEADEVDLRWIVERMVGRNPDDLFPRARAGPRPAARGRVAGRHGPSNPTRLAVDDVSLTVRRARSSVSTASWGPGERELLETLAGRLAAASGTVTLDGKPLGRASIGERIALGVALVPEDRQRDGLVQSMSSART